MTVADWFNSFYRAMCPTFHATKALAYANFTQVSSIIQRVSLLPSSDSITNHWQVYNKAHQKKELKIQKYLSEIAGDAFFSVYFSKFSLDSTTTPLYRRGTHHPYSISDRKCQITKSQALETIYYGQPVVTSVFY